MISIIFYRIFRIPKFQILTLAVKCVGMNNGHTLMLTMERTKLDELTARKSQV